MLRRTGVGVRRFKAIAVSIAASVAVSGAVLSVGAAQVSRPADATKGALEGRASAAATGDDVPDWSPVTASAVSPVAAPPAVVTAAAARTATVQGLWRNLSAVCVGSGTDGARVQVVYAREASTPDRFAQVEKSIRDEIARIDGVLAVSARKTGGGRQVRWVTSDCIPVITRVVVPNGTFAKSSGIESTEKALAARGMAAKNRKYLVFADATRACGVSTIYRDSSATGNANDGTYPQYARVDAPCWNSPDWSVAAHELVHTLGGVQPDAPNALGRYHCDDANDLMCYRETAQTKLRVVCPASHAGLLDCNNDDYFNTAPRKGSYLATRWNVADSSFLEKTPVLSSSVGPRIVASKSGSQVRLSVPRVRGAVKYRWSGRGLDARTGIATTASLSGTRAATYRLTVEMADGVAQTSVVTVR